ncbi:MAG: DUF4136 domain-containing protein [Chlorobi bacterium]|nr:DUF4136 domain-containing protein [Chlorobiota bacterium]
MSKLFYNVIALLVIPLGITMLQGCYPNDGLTAEQTDLVVSTYNDSVDFNTLSTYFMADTVYVLGDGDNKEAVKNPEVILDNIASNMAAAGYSRITEEGQGKPDVVVLAGAVKSTTVNVGWWYPWYPGWGWGGYPGWGWGGWGGYYPPGYYPPYPTYSSYTTGTIVWDMTNPDDYDVIDGDTLARVYWTAGVQGVLNGGNTSTRIKRGIDQAFAQSPQINTNN